MKLKKLYLSIGLLLTVTSVFAQKISKEYSGIILSFDKKTNSACFFVDPQMVDVGVATAIEAEYTSPLQCSDEKYQYGAIVNFDQLSKDSDYPTEPLEDNLIIIKGYWQVSGADKHNVFYVTEWTPFF